MSYPAPIRRQSGRIDVRVPMPAEEEAKKPIAHVPDVHQSILEGWKDASTSLPLIGYTVTAWDGSKMHPHSRYIVGKRQWVDNDDLPIKVFMWKKEE